MADTTRPEAKIPEGMITFVQVAELIGCTRNQVHVMRRQGRLHAIEANGQWWTTPLEARRAAEHKPIKGGRPRSRQTQTELIEGKIASFELVEA